MASKTQNIQAKRSLFRSRDRYVCQGNLSANKKIFREGWEGTTNVAHSRFLERVCGCREHKIILIERKDTWEKLKGTKFKKRNQRQIIFFHPCPVGSFTRHLCRVGRASGILLFSQQELTQWGDTL